MLDKISTIIKVLKLKWWYLKEKTQDLCLSLSPDEWLTVYGFALTVAEKGPTLQTLSFSDAVSIGGFIYWLLKALKKA